MYVIFFLELLADPILERQDGTLSQLIPYTTRQQDILNIQYVNIPVLQRQKNQYICFSSFFCSTLQEQIIMCVCMCVRVCMSVQVIELLQL